LRYDLVAHNVEEELSGIFYHSQEHYHLCPRSILGYAAYFNLED
jgi:hypothetical protein